MDTVILTPEQVESLEKVIKNNSSLDCTTLLHMTNRWWKDNITGYIPYTVHKVARDTFEIVASPELGSS